MSKSYKFKSDKNKFSIKKDQPDFFAPRFLRYNLSFINEDFYSLNDEVHKKFNETLRFISTQPWMLLKTQPKEISNECISIKCMTIPKMYTPFTKLCGTNFTDNGRKLSDKRDVFRLRGTKLGRIIGTIFEFTFYIFYVDVDGECYDHGS